MNEIFMLLPKRVLLLIQLLTCLLFVQSFSVSAQTITNHYDDQQRLTSISCYDGEMLTEIRYTYDAVGNRLTETINQGVAAPSILDSSSKLPSSSNTTNDIHTSSSKLPETANVNTGSSDSSNYLNSDSQNTNRTETTDTKGQDSPPSIIVYEDAQDGTTLRWALNDVRTGAFIENNYDSERESLVITLSGDGLLNSFNLLKGDGSYWNDTDHKIIQWSMKYSEDFVVSVAVQTTDGLRYISFTPDQDDAFGNDTNIFYGLGTGSKDGEWHTYTIDLNYKLHEAQPNIDLISVLGLYVNGSGSVDDIQTLKEIPSNLDSNGNGLRDINEIKAGTNPYRAY